MPKRVFWPITLIILGLILIASNRGLLPMMFWNLWPLLLVIVGLGGLLISDKEEWCAACRPKKTKKSKKRK